MFCENCGNVLNEGAAFCGKCGASEGKYIPPAAPPAPKRKAPYIIVVAVLIIAVVLDSIIIFAGIGSKGVNIAESVDFNNLVGCWYSSKPSNYRGACFTEDGYYIPYKFVSFVEESENHIPNDRSHTWEIVGDDLIRIKGSMGENNLIKVVFSRNKDACVFIYIDELKYKTDGDITKCIEVFRKPNLMIYT